ALLRQRFRSSLRLHLDRQKRRGHGDAQPPFAIQLAPIEDLVGIHLMPACHSGHRCPSYQCLFHDVSTLFNGSAPLLFLRRAFCSTLTECVHGSFSVGTLKCVHPAHPLPTTHTLYRGLQPDAYGSASLNLFLCMSQVAVPVVGKLGLIAIA